jgi:hypothetical protein
LADCVPGHACDGDAEDVAEHQAYTRIAQMVTTVMMAHSA